MTNVKTARDVLDECKMSAAYNDARPHEESGLLIAALTAAGYHITVVRTDDGVRVEAAAMAIMADKADREPHIGAFDYRPYNQGFCVRDHDAELLPETSGHVFLWRGSDGEECQRQYQLAVARRLARLALAAADAVAGAGRDADALTVAAYEEAMASHRALVQRLDVAMNADEAARQASLCDIVDELLEAIRDTARLDWLCQQVVQVRTPLRYGSREGFWASPDEDDEPSDLRAQIDAALAPAAGEVQT